MGVDLINEAIDHDKRWLGVTSGFPYIEMKSLLLWSIVL